MVNLKKFYIVLSFIVVLLVLTSNIVYADNGQITVINPGVVATTSPTTNPTISPNLVISQTPVNVTTQAPVTVAAPTTNVGKLPQTGIEDYTGIIIITVLLAGSSVFAYKKIKDLDRY